MSIPFMRANADIAYSSDYFEALFKNAKQNSVLIIDEAGIVLRINQAFSRCFGYAESDIVGKSARILFTKEDEKNDMFEKEL